MVTIFKSVRSRNYGQKIPTKYLESVLLYSVSLNSSHFEAPTTVWNKYVLHFEISIILLQLFSKTVPFKTRFAIVLINLILSELKINYICLKQKKLKNFYLMKLVLSSVLQIRKKNRIWQVVKPNFQHPVFMTWHYCCRWLLHHYGKNLLLSQNSQNCFSLVSNGKANKKYYLTWTIS